MNQEPSWNLHDVLEWAADHPDKCYVCHGRVTFGGICNNCQKEAIVQKPPSGSIVEFNHWMPPAPKTFADYVKPAREEV